MAEEKKVVSSKYGDSIVSGFRIPVELCDKVDEYANKTYRSRNSILVEALYEYVAKHC